jgi:hypothetical protein
MGKLLLMEIQSCLILCGQSFSVDLDLTLFEKDIAKVKNW